MDTRNPMQKQPGSVERRPFLQLAKAKLIYNTIMGIIKRFYRSFIQGPIFVILFGLVFFYEFTFLSILPMLTEMVPNARATAIAITGTSDAIGRTTGSILGPRLWGFGGLWFNAIASGIAILGSVGLVIGLIPRQLSADEFSGKPS